LGSMGKPLKKRKGKKNESLTNNNEKKKETRLAGAQTVRGRRLPRKVVEMVASRRGI